MRVSIFAAVAISAALTTPLHQSLREQARAGNGTASNSYDANLPRSLCKVPELLARSDLVLRARVLAATTKLSNDEALVLTEYAWSVFRVVDERIGSLTAECAPDRKDLPIDARALLDDLQQPIGQRR
jgi:hypothetical protein